MTFKCALDCFQKKKGTSSHFIKAQFWNLPQIIQILAKLLDAVLSPATGISTGPNPCHMTSVHTSQSRFTLLFRIA